MNAEPLKETKITKERSPDRRKGERNTVFLLREM